jgi:DNA-binding MarR family transcriptional regulator
VAGEVSVAEELDRLALRLNRVAVHLVRGLHEVDRSLGVPPGRLSALSVLVFGGPRTVGALAEVEQVTSPTMTQIVAGLERTGLAERSPHPDDRRATLVSATDEGRLLMLAGRDARVAHLTAVLERLAPDEAAVVSEAAVLLERVAAEL